MAGERGLFRYGFEAKAGFPGHNMWFSKFISETLSMARPYTADPNLDPSGNEGEGENLMAEASGNLVVAPNTEWLLPMRISQWGFYAQTLPAAGVHRYTLRDRDEIADDALEHYVDSLHFGVWRDQENSPSEYNGVGAKVAQTAFAVAANDYVRVTTDLLYLRDRWSRDPSEEAVNAAWTGDIFTIGHRRRGDEAGDHYKFKVSTAGALGVAKFVWGKGAAAYGATEFTTAEEMDIRNADGTIAGTLEEPYRIRIVAPVGAVFTLDDEWFVYPTSPKPVAVFSTRPKLNASKLQIEFSVGGAIQSREIESFTMTHITPREAKFTVGSKYAGRIGRPQDAKNAWEVSIDTTYIDRVLEQALISGTPVSMYAKFYGAIIGATSEYDFAEFTIPTAKLTQAGATVTSAGELPENPVLRAYPSTAGASLCTEVYQNTIASVEPT